MSPCLRPGTDTLHTRSPPGPRTPDPPGHGTGPEHHVISLTMPDLTHLRLVAAEAAAAAGGAIVALVTEAAPACCQGPGQGQLVTSDDVMSCYP